MIIFVDSFSVVSFSARNFPENYFQTSRSTSMFQNCNKTFVNTLQTAPEIIRSNAVDYSEIGFHKILILILFVLFLFSKYTIRFSGVSEYTTFNLEVALPFILSEHQRKSDRSQLGIILKKCVTYFTKN